MSQCACATLQIEEGVAKMLSARSTLLSRPVSVFIRELHPSPIKSRLLPDGALRGKVAFVTGGGTGLGRGMAEMMAALGAEVGIASR